MGAVVQDRLSEAGWEIDEPWTPLRCDLAGPVEEPGLRIEVTGPPRAEVRAAVQRASFEASSFTADRWREMAAGLPYAEARRLVAHDDESSPVAAVTVWSGGKGKPGLLEPMGVHREHRGHGYGRAITLAAGAVATYRSGGFEQLPERRDRTR